MEEIPKIEGKWLSINCQFARVTKIEVSKIKGLLYLYTYNDKSFFSKFPNVISKIAKRGRHSKSRGCVSRGCRGVAHPRNLRRVHFTPPKFDRQLDKRVVKFKVCSKNFLLLRVIFQRSVILHPRFQIPNALSGSTPIMAK